MEIAKIKKTPAKEEKSKMKVKEPPLTPTPTKVIKMTQMNEKIKFRIIKTPIKTPIKIKKIIQFCTLIKRVFVQHNFSLVNFQDFNQLDNSEKMGIFGGFIVVK